MRDLGYVLSSEEHGPSDLVAYATNAEATGFEFAMISDHFHPWTDRQGESPFVWSTLGGIAHATDRLRVGTGVTCPTIRVHPAIVAQAAATAAVMSEGRFFLGVGTGERLNEHIFGYRWPPHDLRLSMLEEAVEVMRELWSGEMMSHRGEHFTVENARLYTLPEEPPDVVVAASGPQTAEVAGRIGDGLVSVGPNGDVVDAFEGAADSGDAPRYGQAHVCWAETEAEARRTVHEWWPNGALPGTLGQELPTPVHFNQATELVTEERATERIPCGPDADRYIETVQMFEDAGFDHVYFHQIGPDQEGFLDFADEEILPSFR